VLLLVRKRAERRAFHLPFGDGPVIAAAGAWCAALVLIRIFDRPLGQGLLALGCAGILVVAGIRERAIRPPDDIPPDDDASPEATPPRTLRRDEELTESFEWERPSRRPRVRRARRR